MCTCVYILRTWRYLEINKLEINIALHFNILQYTATHRNTPTLHFSIRRDREIFSTATLQHTTKATEPRIKLEGYIERFEAMTSQFHTAIHGNTRDERQYMATRETRDTRQQERQFQLLDRSIARFRSSAGHSDTAALVIHCNTLNTLQHTATQCNTP